jgi:hypothetical protein
MEELSQEIAKVTGMAPSTIREQFLRMLQYFTEVRRAAFCGGG